jgi:hypothetical protein
MSLKINRAQKERVQIFFSWSAVTESTRAIPDQQLVSFEKGDERWMKDILKKSWTELCNYLSKTIIHKGILHFSSKAQGRPDKFLSLDGKSSRGHASQNLK